MNKTHTPGPWEACPHQACETLFYIRPQGTATEIATMYNVSCEEKLANAHLIAAAPEMLEALEKIMEAIEFDYGDQKTDSQVSNYFHEIQRLVKKARGDS